MLTTIVIIPSTLDNFGSSMACLEFSGAWNGHSICREFGRVPQVSDVMCAPPVSGVLHGLLVEVHWNVKSRHDLYATLLLAGE